jgi:hypothetical protein
LWAKAASTGFPEGADTCRAKAEQLRAKYGLQETTDGSSRVPRPSKVRVRGRTLVPQVRRPRGGDRDRGPRTRSQAAQKEDAEREAQRLQKDKVDEAEWLGRHVAQDPELQQEWIRQDNLAYGGLIAIGIVLVQPFVAGASLDISGAICAVAFAIAIPLLAALVLVNR